MIGLALEECKKIGIKKVLMICNKDNISSAKSIIKNGGIIAKPAEPVNGKINGATAPPLTAQHQLKTSGNPHDTANFFSPGAMRKHGLMSARESAFFKQNLLRHASYHPRLVSLRFLRNPSKYAAFPKRFLLIFICNANVLNHPI